MRIMKLFGGKALAVALGVAMIPASIAIPQSVPLVGPVAGVSEASAQYYRGGRGHYRGGRHFRGGRDYYRGGRGYYRGHRYSRRGRSNSGAIIGGAIAGLAAGAIIAGASQPRYVERRYVQPSRGYYGRPAPWTNEWYRYCANRYRSFDARSGTFQPYNGPRQLCQ